jgi:hypothetical protein
VAVLLLPLWPLGLSVQWGHLCQQKQALHCRQQVLLLLLHQLPLQCLQPQHLYPWHLLLLLALLLLPVPHFQPQQPLAQRHLPPAAA